MARETVMRELKEKIDFLSREHAGEFMRYQNLPVLSEIIEKGQFDFQSLYEYCEKQDLRIRASEIPSDRIYEVVILLNASMIEDEVFFENASDFNKKLRATGDLLGIQIAEMQKMCDIGSYTLEELLFGIME